MMDRVPPYSEEDPQEPAPPPEDLPPEPPPVPGIQPEAPPPSEEIYEEVLASPEIQPEATDDSVDITPESLSTSYEAPPVEPAPVEVPPLPPPPPVAGRVSGPLSPQDERTWAMLAHLSVLANLVTGFLGPVIALVIYLIYKDRSRYVAYHSMQSFVFQLVFWVGGGVLIGLIWAITGVLSAVLVGLLCIPFAVLGTIVFAAMPLIALIYGIIGAMQTSQGQDFRYWLVGDWVRGTLMV
jgi:uncharacterized protein